MGASAAPSGQRRGRGHRPAGLLITLEPFRQIGRADFQPRNRALIGRCWRSACRRIPAIERSSAVAGGGVAGGSQAQAAGRLTRTCSLEARSLADPTDGLWRRAAAAGWGGQRHDARVIDAAGAVARGIGSPGDDGQARSQRAACLSAWNARVPALRAQTAAVGLMRQTRTGRPTGWRAQAAAHAAGSVLIQQAAGSAGADSRGPEMRRPAACHRWGW